MFGEQCQLLEASVLGLDLLGGDRRAARLGKLFVQPPVLARRIEIGAYRIAGVRHEAHPAAPRRGEQRTDIERHPAHGRKAARIEMRQREQCGGANDTDDSDHIAREQAILHPA